MKKLILIVMLVMSTISQLALANSTLSFTCDKQERSNKLRCTNGIAVNFPISYIRSSYEHKVTLAFECLIVGGDKLDAEALCDISLFEEYNHQSVPVEITSFRRTPLY